MGRASVGTWGLVVVVVAAWWVQQAAGQQCNKTTACADATDCCSQYGYCGTTDDYCVTGCQNGPCRTTFTPPPPPVPPMPPSPPPPPRPHVSPSPDRGAGRIITRRLFEALYPDYNKTFYSYDAFIVAARAFPLFLTQGSREERLRELAAFSAHVQQETAGASISSLLLPTSLPLHLALICANSHSEPLPPPHVGSCNFAQSIHIEILPHSHVGICQNCKDPLMGMWQSLPASRVYLVGRQYGFDMDIIGHNT